MSRKLVVIAGIGLIVVLAGLPSIVAWLNGIGLTACARWVRMEYLTGTAVTVIITMVILLPSSDRGTRQRRMFAQICPVCEAPLGTSGRYCPRCGSRT